MNRVFRFALDNLQLQLNKVVKEDLKKYFFLLVSAATKISAFYNR